MNKIFIDEVISEIHTIQDILRWTISQFNNSKIYYGHGTDNPLEEALSLILPSLSLPPNVPDLMYSSRLTLRERIHLIKLVMRRIIERVPVAYLTNQAWFCGLRFYVDKRVLIPRSPIGELITKRFNGIFNNKINHVLDLCTGSGCIAIAIAVEFPELEIDASDISSEALSVAEHNIQYHGVESQVTPIRSDLFLNLPLLSYDLIITNPPYVDDESMKNLPDEFYLEPKLALYAGRHGLRFIEKILTNASNYLSKEGILICETGSTMVHLLERYPEIPFRWLKLNNGGDGVFMFTRSELILYNKFFKLC